MTNFGFCFRPDLHRDDCSGFLHLWVEDSRGRVRSVPTSYDVSHDEWDAVIGWFVRTESAGQRQLMLRHYAECMRQDLDTLERIVGELESKGRCTASNILNIWSLETGA